MIGHKIKRYRELRNYSQDYLASKLGISQNAYSKIETNQTKLRVDRLKQIAAALEIPEEELINSETSIVFNNGHFEKNNIAHSQIFHEAQKLIYENTIEHLKEELKRERMQNEKRIGKIMEQFKASSKEKESLVELLRDMGKILSDIKIPDRK